ncbi:hypothetical protein [Micropruina sp.]|uniref:hypothetical protein n=1 Tax=Micropruina sp. TaxID=2737536 RepID=UPI0039E32A61
MTDFPICDWSGLMRISCPPECPDHGSGFTGTAAEQRVMLGAIEGAAFRHPVTHIADLEHVAGRPLPAYRATQRPTGGPWTIERIPADIGCPNTHGRPPGAQLCHACANLLHGLLADTPELITELATARRRGVRFVGGTDDAGGVPWSEAASRCHRDLVEFGAELPDLDQHTALVRLGHLHRLGRRIIDRPRDLINLGNCPICSHEIRQERPTVTELEQATAQVRCSHTPVDGPSCPYRADWHDHQRKLLDQRADMLLTINELVGVLTEAGEPVSRDRIKYLIRKHGLPRERITRPHLRGKAIVTEQVWVHRLGDVRDMIAEMTANAAHVS